MNNGSTAYMGDYYEDYDASGIPIYGYDGSYPVYGYDAAYQPIYSTAELSRATYVPSWAPRGNAPVNYPAHVRRGAIPPRNAHHRHVGEGGLRGSARRVHHASPITHGGFNSPGPSRGADRHHDFRSDFRGPAGNSAERSHQPRHTGGGSSFSPPGSRAHRGNPLPGSPSFSSPGNREHAGNPLPGGRASSHPESRGESRHGGGSAAAPPRRDSPAQRRGDSHEPREHKRDADASHRRKH